MRQYRYPFSRTLLEVPAGKLEPGEAPELAAARELLRLSDRAGSIAQQIYEEQKEDTPCGC